ncbi:myosin heavy chain, embryonic smooth muscle isoform isoform X2 [Nothobranchius furzeri]|uniref:Transcript variant X2 n=2 Tax=Nothobranchius furzeri TaxID=105023 RepID=A0A9D2YX88_NOTFU|nr:transcript variant X2 [Nothobranchius furzeri]
MKHQCLLEFFCIHMNFIPTWRKGYTSRMSSTEETISVKELQERIAELDYNQNQLRELNDEMRSWLDVADDDIASLRSENTTLRKQVKELEKVIFEAQQVEAEPCEFLTARDLAEKRFSVKEIQDLERKSNTTKEENKMLTVLVRNLEEEREEDKMTLSNLRASFQSMQKDLQIKHLEETMEEYTDIIKDLRTTKQELSKQLEDRLDEASFPVLAEVMGEDEGLVSSHLSLAEEIQLLVSSAEMNPSRSSFTDLTLVASDEEEKNGVLLDSPKADLSTEREEGLADASKTNIHGSSLFKLCIFTLSFLVSAVLGCVAGNLFSSNILQSGSQLMLEPYISVQYNALPPV